MHIAVAKWLPVMGAIFFFDAARLDFMKTFRLHGNTRIDDCYMLSQLPTGRPPLWLGKRSDLAIEMSRAIWMEPAIVVGGD
jgi:hypothetical protein